MACADCFTGHVHLGTPTGEATTLHGIRTYVAAPEGAAKGVIVYIPDAFGWQFVNNRLLADSYAKAGFLVYLPDFMCGHALPLRFLHLMEDKIKKPAGWLTTIFLKPFWIFQVLRMLVPFLIVNRKSAAQPRIFNFVAAVRKAETGLKVGAAGFCWGGKYTMLLAHDEPSSRVTVGGTLQPLIECGFTAHPSLVSLPSDIERVQRPLSVIVGNEDSAMNAAGIRQMEGILKKVDHHEVVILEGAKHGFAVRIDPTDELQNNYAKQAEGQAIAWFSKWLQG